MLSISTKVPGTQFQPTQLQVSSKLPWRMHFCHGDAWDVGDALGSDGNLRPERESKLKIFRIPTFWSPPECWLIHGRLKTFATTKIHWNPTVDPDVLLWKRNELGCPPFWDTQNSFRINLNSSGWHTPFHSMLHVPMKDGLIWVSHSTCHELGLQ